MNPEINILARKMNGEIEESLFIELNDVSWEHSKCHEIEEIAVSYGSQQGSRKRNEDRSANSIIHAANGVTYFLAIVCDGVGGSQHGDLAASIAIATCISELSKTKTKLSSSLLATHIVRRMDDKVRDCLEGAGLTTASIFLASSSGEAVSASIGDSRIYSWTPDKDKKLTQISEDDTLANEAKKLNLPDISALAQKGISDSLSQALGEPGRNSKDLQIKVINHQDFTSSIAICSDGCWKQNPAAFELIIINSKSSLEACRRVLASANWMGGTDNASIIIIQNIEKIINYCSSSALINHKKLSATTWLAEQKTKISISYIITRQQSSELYADRNIFSNIRRQRAIDLDRYLQQVKGIEQPSTRKRKIESKRPDIEIKVDPNPEDKNKPE